MTSCPVCNGNGTLGATAQVCDVCEGGGLVEWRACSRCGGSTLGPVICALCDRDLRQLAGLS